MASVQTGIQLNDQFSAVLNGIVNSVNMAVAAMYDMQQSMSADIDTSGIDGVRDEINQTVAALHEMTAAMNDQAVPDSVVDGYEQLADRVNRTGLYIRDNTYRQEEFNQRVQDGTEQANGLANMVKYAAMAYAGIRGAGKALEISDELTLTMSRLDMMNDGLQSTQELMNMVYAAAQDARGSFADMAGVVARFGNNARDAFGSSEEVVAFADLVQKQMTIAGAGTQEASNAMLQLSQALGSGVLRGDELNSIFEQAPNLIQSIADYLDVPIGQIREMASEGELSADVVKAAVFASADDINANFEQMPMTWGQVWQSMQNTALVAFQPVLQRLNDIANSEAFQAFADGAVETMAAVSNAVLNVFDMIGVVGSFAADNWAIVGPIVYGIVGALAVYAAYLAIVNGLELAAAAGGAVMAVGKGLVAAATMIATGATWAQTTAQMGLNSAMYACPILWIILLIIALVSVILAVCGAIAKMTGVTQSGFGLICGIVAVAVSFILNQVIGLINTVITWIVDFYNMGANFAAAFGILFNDPVAAIKAVMLSLFNFIVSGVRKAAAMLDALFGSNLAGAVSQFQGKIQAEINATVENAGGERAELLNPADYMLDRIDYGATFDKWSSWGDGISEAVGNFSLADLFGQVDVPNVDDYTAGFGDYSSGLGDTLANSGIGDNLGKVAGDTAGIRDALDVTQEDLKYLRDIAEQEAVNRYTVAEIHIDQSGMQNTINSGDDIDGFMEKLTDSVNETIDNMTEGVHE